MDDLRDRLVAARKLAANGALCAVKLPELQQQLRMLLDDLQGQQAVNDLFIARNFDRDSFDASLALARALYLAERFDDAISQFTGSEQLVETDIQQAEVYYWRAQAHDSAGDHKSAANDYQALLDMPAETVADEWIEYAQEYLLELTPTPTMTASPPPATNTPTIVLPTSTSTMTPTASPTLAPRPSTTPRPRH